MEVTPFLQIPDGFSSPLARTPEEAATTVSELDLSFIQNLSEVEKMCLVSEVTHNIYRASFLFSVVVVVGRRDILVVGNPPKKRETWKGKCMAIKHKCSTFKKELDEL